MNKKLILLLCCSMSLIGLSAFTKAKDDPFATLLKNLTEYAQKYPSEKVHLHLDKPYYAAGDDIWFKAYVVDSKTNAPTALSKIVYVELINEKSELKKQLKLQLLNGIAWGDFKLIDTLHEGNYRVRAYTQWMRNASPDFFFDQTIKIGNSLTSKVFTNANYKFLEEGKSQKINSTIQFTNAQQKPYNDCEVNYNVELGDKTVSRNKAKTNAKGEINFQFTNEQPELYKSGTINVTITLPTKEKVSKNIPLLTTSAMVDVQFFPESGELIEGIPSKIAIKATNALGKGEDISGIIVDNDEVEINRFETAHLGMGSFSLNPMTGKTYQAKIKFKNGTEKVITLPAAKPSGYVLSINNSDSTKVNAKVLISADLIGKGELNLLLQKNGLVCFTAKIPNTQNFATVTLPKDKLPSGIVTATLFNSANLPVAERLLFINNNYDKLETVTDKLKDNYEKRGKMDLTFMSKNEGEPAIGSFSVAITNASIVTPDENNESNILTSLLLTSDLKGYIEDPNYYFLSNNPKASADLDLLLLTQGWRKINWKSLAADQTPTNSFAPETDLNISGIATNFYTNKPIVKSKVSLLSPSQDLFTASTLTDANGRFNFSQLVFPDSTKMVITALTEKGKKEVQIKLDSQTEPPITINKNIGDLSININEELKGYLEKSEDFFNEQVKQGRLTKTIMLDKVEVFGQKKLIENSANLNNSKRADRLILAKDLANTADLSSALRKVGGLKIDPDRIFSYSNTMDTSKPDAAMNVIIDGIWIGQEFHAQDFPVQDVEAVEVLTSPSNISIYGSRGGAGILIITTKRGGYTVPEGHISLKENVFYPKGYAISREFYMPQHDATTNDKPDLRTTVYWNPALISDAQGKFKIDYFNTDQAGLYRIVIEGIDEYGNLARKTYTYQVY